MPDNTMTGEPSAVQLTRMEGVLNVIAERLATLGGRVDVHDRELDVVKNDVAGLKSETQTLRESATAEREKAVALALALEKAEFARRTKSEQAWSPFQKGTLLIGGLVGIVALWAAIFPPVIP